MAGAHGGAGLGVVLTWGWLGPSVAMPPSTQNKYGEIHFCGVTYMGPHIPGSIGCTLWFGLTFWGGPGGWLGPWAVAMKQQKSLTLMQKKIFSVFNSEIQCWSVIVFGQILAPFVCPSFFSKLGAPTC